MKNLKNEISKAITSISKKQNLLTEGNIFDENDWAILSGSDTSMNVKKNDLVLVGCQPGFTTRSFILSLLNNIVIENNKSLLLHSGEFSVELIIKHLFSIGTGIDKNRIESCALLARELKQMKIYTQKLKEANLKISIFDEIRIEALFKKCRLLKSKGKLDVIIVDISMIMNADQTIRKSSLIKHLKKLANECHTPVFLIYPHINILLERKSNRKKLIKNEAYQMFNDVNKILFLNNFDKSNKIKLFVVRNGLKENQKLSIRFNRKLGKLNFSKVLTLL
jgi:hypothetical protein